MRKTHIILLAVILVAAGALRIVAAARCDTVPDYSDMATYNRLALAGGIPLSPPPGYPLLLRGIYFLFGPADYTAVFVVQALMSTATVLLIFLTGRAVRGPVTGLIAAGTAAVYPNFILYNLTTLTEPTALLLTMAMLRAAVPDREGRTRPLLATAALFAGAAVRPAFLYFWPGMLAVVKRRTALLAVTVAVLGPVIAYGVMTGTGTNRWALAFYKSYNEEANGVDFYTLDETDLGSRDLPSGVYVREAARWIVSHPWRTVDILYNKASVVFARGWDSFVLRPMTGDNRHLVNALEYAYLPVMLLGFIGIVRFRDERSRALALPTLSYLLFFVLLAIFKVRYRLLAEPALIIFAAVSVGHLLRIRECRRGVTDG
jgi:4-amino-4-deoxy-L-arabinose transferase-like glycosyltransferase